MIFKPMERVFTFIYCEGKEVSEVTYKLPVPAHTAQEAINKFWQLIHREVFIKEINESTRYVRG